MACLGGGLGGVEKGVITFVGAEFTSHNNHEFLIIPIYLRLLVSRINRILMSTTLQYPFFFFFFGGERKLFWNKAYSVEYSLPFFFGWGKNYDNIINVKNHHIFPTLLFKGGVFYFLFF